MAFRGEVRSRRPGRTAFNLSHERVFTCNMGQLIPILSEFMVPGDTFNISTSSVVRFNPLIHPLMHEVNVFTHYFYVPIRLLYPLDPPDDTDSRINPFCWEDFITGGADALGTSLDVSIDNVKINPWFIVPNIAGGASPTTSVLGGLVKASTATEPSSVAQGFSDGALWDFFRFAPARIIPDTSSSPDVNDFVQIINGNHSGSGGKGDLPIDAPWRAYSFIWWQYYRDEVLEGSPTSSNRTTWTPYDRNIYRPIDDLSFFSSGSAGSAPQERNFDPLLQYDYRRPKYRAYEKDYFLSAQLQPQRGAPGVVTATGLAGGILPVNFFSDGSFQNNLGPVGWSNVPTNPATSSLTPNPNAQMAGLGNDNWSAGAPAIGAYASVVDAGGGDYHPLSGADVAYSNISNYEGRVGAIASPLANEFQTAFDINALRVAYSMQHYAEVVQQFGTRYTEWLYGQFGFSPRDERLQRPEYVGGSVAPVIFSEVLQTSQSVEGESALGQLGGHGMSVNGDFIGSYTAQEYGILMGLLSVMPRSTYGNGNDKAWFINSRYDVYTPSFAFIGEQAIDLHEVSAVNLNSGNTAGNFIDFDGLDYSALDVFGYQGAFDYLRQRTSSFHGLMHNDLASWHLGRILYNRQNSGSSNVVALNTDLITAATDDWDRAFAVTSEVADELVITVGQDIKAIRPMPFVAVPHIDGMEDM